ncbi:manganese peroxidase 1 [Fomitiporia mediterranea MF3/22]|uniref:manganese peroxidase 1 n=1 Tax=Fomitiporia mediterranea (strain MF3/22) TaxID=694068 RepID=UPI0004407740|nr:manganese peroxidase 1 [Fomitiporia mediterranea MF3/22]EJD05363.1 manganese peroxidase 1 [Fomitiporia mediterranea MF3/22]
MSKLSVAFVALAALVNAANYKRVTCPDGVNTATNEACCPFFALRDDLQANLFNNTCGEDVHETLRLTFHDAIGFSSSGALSGGGADGSIILFSGTELAFVANAGVDDGVDALAPFLQTHNVTAGDLIQFAGAVGTTNCPGAPKLQFLAGRANATAPASDGTVPLPQDSADSILSRMADAGISNLEVIHLLASHSIARSDTLVPNHTAVPFDTTPFTFDPQIFLEVLLKGTGIPFGVNNTDGAEVDSPLPDEGEMRLQSDFVLSRDSRTACEWQSMIADQQLMMSNFQSAMAKMAVIGFDSSTLVDCSEVIPDPIAPVGSAAVFPAGTSQDDVEQACTSAFPSLSTDAGSATQIPACPDGDLNINDCPS